MAGLFRDFACQEEIDAQYRIAPTAAALEESRRRAQELSAQARRELRPHTGVRYGPTLSEYLHVFPVTPAQAPVFVFFHGGFWRAMAAEDYGFAAVGPVSRGVLTVAVNYALAPKVTIDEIVRQARAAVFWVHQHISDYGGDSRRIVVGGHSAGAQLAAMCALTAWSDDYALPADTVKGLLLVSGIFDLSPLRYSYLQPQIQLDEGLIRRNSPIENIKATGIPALLAVGQRETSEFHRQSAEFHQAWSADHDSALEIVPGADHALALEQLIDPNSSMCDWIERTAKR